MSTAADPTIHVDAITARPPRRSRVVIKILLGLFGTISFATGLWAVVDPVGWFRQYPGLGHHWVAVQGPFNRHLATDAGAGFLAVGVVLLLALAWTRRATGAAAGAALLAHSIPHFVFHLTHRVAGFSTVDTLLGVWGILVEAIAGLLLLSWAWRLPP